MKVNEKGVLPGSEMFIHHPGSFAESHIISLYFSGKFICNNEYLVERKDHDFLLLIRQTEGNLFLDYQGQEYALGPNEILLIDCRLPHSYWCRDYCAFEFIHFRGGPSRPYYERILSLFGPVISSYPDAPVIDSLKRVLKMMAKEELNEDLAAIEMQRILSHLITRHSVVHSEPADAMKETLNFLNANFTKDLSLQAIAEKANMSPYHFARKFKSHLGISPHHYLIYKRLSLAKELLISTTLNINEVAEQTGFHTPSHFIATFRKQTGMTPLKFRSIRF